MIEVPLSKSGKNKGLYTAFIDEEDKELAGMWWTYHKAKGGSGYAKRNFDNKMQYMHRIVLASKLGRELEPWEEVDHINENKLDNRRENLRLATSGENKRNRGAQRNNKLGVKGVYFDARDKLYYAQIQTDRQWKKLGCYKTLEEAKQAYKNAAEALHKDFANTGGRNGNS